MIRLSRLCRPAVCAGLITAVCAVAPPLAGQDFFEIVDVPLVEVEVAVTDTRGRPVGGLARDAFMLLVDGEEQQISFFTAPAAVSAPGAVDAEARPAHLVLLFDNEGVESQSRNAVIDDYRKFLGQLSGPMPEIMVATAGGAGLEIEQEFTNEPGWVDAALERVAATVARDRHVTEYESLLLDIQRLAGSRDPTRRDSTSQATSLVSRIIAFSEGARQVGLQTAGHISQLAEALAGLPGQKSILYIGGAVSVSPGEALLTALKGILDRSGDEWARRAGAELPAGVASGGSSEIDALSMRVSRRGVAVYSFLVGGSAQVVSTGSSASSPTAKDSSTMDSSGSWSPGFDSRSRNESRSALDSLAAATGGFVHARTGGAQPALQRIHDQMGLRYVLGFYPPVGADGQPHEISVQLREPGALVRHRQSFQARGWDDETASRLRSALFSGAGVNRHSVELAAQLPTPGSKGSLRVPLTLRFPLSSLAIEPVRDTHRGQASIFVTSLGGSRFETRPVRKSVLSVVLPNRDLQGAMGQMAEYRLDLEVPEDTRSLAVAVRDDLSTELSIVRLGVPVDEVVRVEPAAAPTTDTGLIDDAPTPVRLPSAALLMSGQQGGSLILRSDETRFVSKDSSTMHLVVEVPETRFSGTSFDFEIHVYVLDAAGRPLSRSARRARLEPMPASDSLNMLVETVEASDSLSILVRDLETNDFGLVRVPLADSVTRGAAKPSNELSLDLRVAPGEETQPAAQALGTIPARPAGPPGKGHLSIERVSQGLLDVLELMASSRSSQARTRLRDLEIEATSGQSPMAVIDLGRREARVVATLADSSWERLLPLAMLWGELIDDYRDRRLGPLSEHAIAMSTQLAVRLGRQARTLESRREASNLLLSLSGSLLYSQRLGRTEELLELAIQVDDQNETARVALAATHEQQGDFEGAIAVLGRLLELAPNSGEGRLRMAVNLVRTDRPERAVAYLRALLAGEEEEWVSQVASQELARLLALSGQGDEAVQVLKAAIELWPEEPAMQVQLAWLLDQGHRTAEAEVWVSRVAEGAAGPGESPRFRYHRWYLEGLAGVRDGLSRSSVKRAKEACEILAQKPAATGGS